MKFKKRNNWSRRNLIFLWNICWLWQPWKISLDIISLRMIILNYIKSFPPNDGSKDKKPKYKWIQIHKTFHNWFFATLFLIFSLIDLISICTYLIYNIWFATYVIISLTLYYITNDNITISWDFLRLTAPAAMPGHLGAVSLKKI